MAEISRRAGVRRFVLLGSYFAHFHRLWPHLELTRHHPYIRSRVEQSAAAMKAAGEEMAVMTLELPYIFGVMPGRIPLWKPLVEYAAFPFPLFYPKGGTTCVTVAQVAQAITGAVEKGEWNALYPIGGENLAWTDLMSSIAKFAGRDKRVISLPNWLVTVGGFYLRLVHKLKDVESGLEPVQFIKLQTAKTNIDPEISRLILGYEMGGLDEEIRETVQVCLNKKDPARGS